MGNKNPKFSYTIRIIAGAYVAYLGISASRAALRDGTTSSVPVPVIIGVGAALAVTGAVLVILGFKGYKYMKDHPEEFEDPEEMSEEEGSSEECPVQTGIHQKASMPEHLKITEESEQDPDEERDVTQDQE